MKTENSTERGRIARLAAGLANAEIIEDGVLGTRDEIRAFAIRQDQAIGESLDNDRRRRQDSLARARSRIVD